MSCERGCVRVHIVCRLISHNNVWRQWHVTSACFSLFVSASIPPAPPRGNKSTLVQTNRNMTCTPEESPGEHGADTTRWVMDICIMHSSPSPFDDYTSTHHDDDDDAELNPIPGQIHRITHCSCLESILCNTHSHTHTSPVCRHTCMWIPNTTHWNWFKHLIIPIT